jgi:hypothetical protein
MVAIGQISTDAANDNGISLPHTCAEGESLLLVCLSFKTDKAQVGRSVTYANLPLTFISKSQIASDVAEEMWVLYSPPAGDAAVVVTLNRVADIVCAAVSFSGAPEADAFYTDLPGAGQDAESVDFLCEVKKDTAIVKAMTLSTGAVPTLAAGQQILWDVLYNGLRSYGLSMNPTADAIVAINNSLDQPSDWAAHVLGIQAS